MEAVIFIGIQATGKSEFYKRRFFKTHLRINMDMLRTRHREDILFRASIEVKQPFVVDNTNPTASERAKYIIAAKNAGFKVTGYYFKSVIKDALALNDKRPSEERIPVAGVAGTYKKLELPKKEEGFDALYYVQMASDFEFIVEDYSDEI
ncbi:MAG: ATP-binding protein [Synergistaceae bacterium]|jgi:predicted kinase|nr:ATP-binding protein [Synergistaceae bacterium]